MYNCTIKQISFIGSMRREHLFNTTNYFGLFLIYLKKMNPTLGGYKHASRRQAEIFTGQLVAATWDSEAGSKRFRSDLTRSLKESKDRVRSDIKRLKNWLQVCSCGNIFILSDEFPKCLSLYDYLGLIPHFAFEHDLLSLFVLPVRNYESTW